MKSVSIILVDYNSHQHTEECLASLEKANFKGLDVDVIVVDNGSKVPLHIDTTYKNFKVVFLHSEQNSGFTGGNNQGILYALDHFTPDYLLLLNNDTVVEPKFLTELVNYAESSDQVGVVSPMIYFAKGYEFHAEDYAKEDLGKVIWFAGGSIDWKNMYAFHRGVDQVDRGQFDWPTLSNRREKLKSSVPEKEFEVPYISAQEMDFATGCSMLIPRTVIEQVGVFDESYFLYWEDVDLSQRIKNAGYKLYFYPPAKIWHKNAGSSGGSGSSLHQQYQERNRLRFAKKYAPWKTRLALLKSKVLK